MLAFIKVVDCRSFTAAAERLGVSKSVISRRLGELENRLGVRLVNRTTRSLSLTDIGQAYYSRCARVLADLDEAERTITDLHGSLRGPMRINGPVSFGRLHLGPAVAAFLHQNPDITIDLDLNDRFVDLVEEGYDLAVRIGRLKDSSLIARRLAPNRLVFCASPDYLARHGVPEKPEHLGHHACLLYTNLPMPEIWPFQDRDGSLRSLRVEGRLRTNNGDLICRAAEAGLGVAILPSFLAGEALSAGRLQAILDPWADTSTAVHAVYPHNRHLSPKIRAFVDFLAARFGPVPYWDAGLAEPVPHAEAAARARIVTVTEADAETGTGSSAP